MIISNSRKFVFIHIPKSGGTTVYRFLHRNMLPQDVSLGMDPSKGWRQHIEAFREQFGLFKHSTSKELSVAMGVNYYREYEIFTFCRNPFARAFSSFTFTKKADERLRPTSQRYLDMKDMSFEDFLGSTYFTDRKLLQTRPQIHWVKPSPVDVVSYKLEDVENEFVRLAERYKLRAPNPSSIGRANASSPPDAWKGMSEKAEELIRDAYAEDFAHFQYDDRVPRP